MNRNLYLILLLLLAFFIRSYDITEPAIGPYSGGVTYHGNIARNYLRYGICENRTAAIVNFGLANEDEYQFYMNHPPLFYLLLAGSYGLFGGAEWTIRIVSIFFGLMSVVAIYLLASKLYDVRTGIISGFLLVLFPVNAYFDSIGEPSIAVVPLVILVLYFYLQWLSSGEKRHLALTLAAIAVGGWIDWQAYIILPFVLGHHLFVLTKDQRQMGSLSIIMLTGVISFSLFLLRYYFVIGDLSGLLHTLEGHATADETYRFSFMQYLVRMAGNIVIYTSPVALFLGIFSWRKIFPYRRHFQENFILLSLLGFYLVMFIVLKKYLWIHVYYTEYLTPFIAVTGALGALSLYESLKAKMRFARLAFSTFLFLFAVTSAFSAILIHERKFSIVPVEVGKFIQANTRVSDRLITSFDYMDVNLTKEDRYGTVSYYADRYIVYGVKDTSTFRSTLESNRNMSYFLFLETGTIVEQSFREFLEGNYQLERKIPLDIKERPVRGIVQMAVNLKDKLTLKKQTLYSPLEQKRYHFVFAFYKLH